MPLVKAICTNCGGQLEVDSEKKAAICPYCKQAYVVEDAINNYVSYQTTNIAHADVVQVSDDRNAKARLEAADTYMKLGQYEAARAAYEEACKLTPQDYRTWWGQVSADIAQGKRIDPSDVRYQNALKTAPADVVPQLRQSLQKRLDAWAREDREAEELRSAEWEQLKAKARELVPALQKLEEPLSGKRDHYKKLQERVRSPKNLIAPKALGVLEVISGLGALVALVAAAIELLIILFLFKDRTLSLIFSDLKMMGGYYFLFGGLALFVLYKLFCALEKGNKKAFDDKSAEANRSRASLSEKRIAFDNRLQGVTSSRNALERFIQSSCPAAASYVARAGEFKNALSAAIQSRRAAEELLEKDPS